MTPAKTIQQWATIAAGAVIMLSAVMLAMAPTLMSVFRCGAYLVAGAITAHMFTRPDPPAPADPDVILDALLAEHPVLGDDPAFASQLAATAHRAARNPKRSR